MKIKPKLYLNGSPQTAEEGSLAFARNMKIDNDGNLVSDYGYKTIAALKDYNIVGHIVGLDDKVYLFTDKEEQIEIGDNLYKTVNTILEYDELDETVTILKTGWKYSNGEISGYVSTNISGEKILTIGEYKEDDNIPLKHINLSYCSYTDDESLYCQAPICPTANLILKDTYVKTIPNGVYIFFIRYKIRKNVYTNWFLCSRPIYGGCSEKITTFQGGLNYINLHKDSAKSFIFDLNFAQEENKNAYKEFQLGFIINHDEATDARTWKHFDINTKTIYFDYENVEETNIDELLKVTYELYNVRNITAFKNKLYISNYKETNFNYNANLDDVIDLKVKDTYDTSSDIPKASLDGYDLYYNNNSEFKYFDKTSTGVLISEILKENQFDYNIDNLSENKTISPIAEGLEAGTFTIEWHNSTNPDVAFITKVENKLYNNCIFGESFEKSYPTDQHFDDMGMGLISYGIGQFGRHGSYYPIIETNTGNNIKYKNSLYNLGFTCGFGSTKTNSDTFDISNLFNPYSSNLNTLEAYNNGFNSSNINSIKNTIIKEIENRSFFAKAYIIISSGANSYKIGYKTYMNDNTYAGINMNFNIFAKTDDGVIAYPDYKLNSYKYYKDADLTVLNPYYFSIEKLHKDFKSNIHSWVFNTIQPITKGISIDNEGNSYLLLDLSEYGGNTKTIVNNIQIVFRKIDFKVAYDEITSDDANFKANFNISMDSREYISNCNFNFNSSLIVDSTPKVYSQFPSLMPFSTYRPYIHFVDNHNIITNGIKLKDIKTEGITDYNSVLSLAYKLNIDYNNIYKSFFISIKNIGDIIIEGFGYKKLENNTHILNFLELDTLLYNINDNITIIDNTGVVITTTAKYYSSGSSNPSLAFGNCGYVSWNNDENNYINKKLYIKIIRDFNDTIENNLIKASGYIPLTKTDDYIEVLEGYYGSWFCSVTKPDFDLSSSCYVSGKDIYSADRSTDSVKLKDFEGYVTVSPSNIYYIRSNFNLNYLTLTEDITDTIFSIGNAGSGNKQVAKVINSAILSYIYELKSMYKDFTNKTFSAYDKDYKIQFNNTIRVSTVISDESYNNSIFSFYAEDYYNIPTDRGIIVNLFAIGNSIYAHTKNSFYKFDATKTIMSSNEDIKLQESEPFDVGLTQIFDSQYGYGGIENKESGCITFDSYFFYDNKNNHIFSYSGNGQIQLIDGSIYKFLTYFKPKSCRTIHDSANNRIFFEFCNIFGSLFTLSYNYKSKSFVSFHDITLEKTFSTRNFSYSYLNRFDSLFVGDFNTSEELIAPFVTNALYGTASKLCKISGDTSPIDYAVNYEKNSTIGSYFDKYNQSSPFVLSIIAFPREYIREIINSISYLAYKIENIVEEKGKNICNINGCTEFSWYNLLNKQIENENPIKKLYVITDNCVSTPIENTVDDSARPNSLLDYKGFKYDKGLWNANYFRNAANVDNIYNYPDQPRNNAIPNNDNYSLVYGRYFILNFNLTKDFPVKFEEIFINSEKC